MNDRHGCVFCPKRFGRLDQLVEHLCGSHQKVKVLVGDQKVKFRILLKKGLVSCFCARRFTHTQMPLFGPGCVVESNSFTAHLVREGGLEAHLQNLRDRALMDRVAECCDTPKGPLERDWCAL